MTKMSIKNLILTNIEDKHYPNISYFKKCLGSFRLEKFLLHPE